jgi:hypothetical protein
MYRLYSPRDDAKANLGRARQQQESRIWPPAGDLEFIRGRKDTNIAIIAVQIACFSRKSAVSSDRFSRFDTF